MMRKPVHTQSIKKIVTVGIFAHQGKRSVQYQAYTTWYNPEWEGCCEHVVEATSGNEAKKLAIAEHIARCA